MRLKFIMALLCVGGSVLAQDAPAGRIKGLRVIGEKKAMLPIAGIDGQPITIEFDTDGSQPYDFRLKFYHCDKDWRITNNSFINDELRTTTKFQIPYEPAPAFVRHYTFHHSVNVPGFAGFKRFPQSGNYVFQIWDHDEKEMLGEGRFFVAEQTLSPVMKVRNRKLPGGIAPWNQANKVEVFFEIPEGGQGDSDLYPILLKTVDVYKNRELRSPFRISADDQSANTFVEGYGLRKVKFSIDNITSGNEYRRLDLRNVDFYPPGQDAQFREGADVSRFLHQGKKDNNGAAVIATVNQYSDYLRFQFELLRESDDLDSVFVVGDFNDWTPSEGSLMKYDRETGRYRLTTWLRRGVYDYQYVVGRNDWITIEGNDWRTVNLYTAFIYYHDPRYGGFDRIVGFVQALGPGDGDAAAK